MSVIRLLLVSFAAICLCACSKEKPHCILPPMVELRTGDLVLRRGGGFTSRAVMFADDDGMYSHIGIVVDSAGVPMIAHAVPDEPDFKGDEDRVKLETPQEFYSSLKTDIGCIMRCKDSIAADKAAAKAFDIYRRGTAFDHDYDVGDTTKMYCCELVAYAYSQAGMSLVTPPFHDINLPGMDFKNVILPSDLQNSDKIRLVVAF